MFSLVNTLETQLWKMEQDSDVKAISEQSIMDCVWGDFNTNIRNYGCDGGT